MATPSLNMYCQTETMRCELYPVPPLLSCSALTRIPLLPLWHPPTAITLRAACSSPSSNIHMHCFLPEYPHIKEPRTSFNPPPFREQSHSDSDSDSFSLSFPSPFPFLLTLG